MSKTEPFTYWVEKQKCADCAKEFGCMDTCNNYAGAYEDSKHYEAEAKRLQYTQELIAEFARQLRACNLKKRRGAHSCRSIGRDLAALLENANEQD